MDSTWDLCVTGMAFSAPNIPELGALKSQLFDGASANGDSVRERHLHAQECALDSAAFDALSEEEKRLRLAVIDALEDTKQDLKTEQLNRTSIYFISTDFDAGTELTDDVPSIEGRKLSGLWTTWPKAVCLRYLSAGAPLPMALGCAAEELDHGKVDRIIVVAFDNSNDAERFKAVALVLQRRLVSSDLSRAYCEILSTHASTTRLPKTCTFFSLACSCDFDSSAKKLLSKHACGDIKPALGGWSRAQMLSGPVAQVAELAVNALALFYRHLPLANTPDLDALARELNQGAGTKAWFTLREPLPWDISVDAERRQAGVVVDAPDQAIVTLLIQESGSFSSRQRYLSAASSLQIFPLAAISGEDIEKHVLKIERELEQGVALSSLSAQYLRDWRIPADARGSICILARDKTSFEKEAKRIRKFLSTSDCLSRKWQSPAGSIYVPASQRLGEKNICFVYPGAFNAYVGLGQKLTLRFPQLNDKRHASNGKPPYDTDKLFLKTCEKPGAAQIEAFALALGCDIPAMLKAGISFACDATDLMQSTFGVKADRSIGYSLGELSMLFAQGVYQRSYETMLKSNSELLTRRTTGELRAAYEYWGKQAQTDHTAFWANFVLLEQEENVQKLLKHYDKIFITHVNCPGEVVIAGDPSQCQSLIEQAECRFHPVPLPHLFHTPCIRSEKTALADLMTFPIKQWTKTTLYSSHGVKPLSENVETITDCLSDSLVEQVHFQSLIQHLYAAGTNVFIEMGPANTCTRWISETLKDKSHIAVALNNRGVDDYSSVVKAIARLLCYGVDVSLGYLIELAQPKARQILPLWHREQHEPVYKPEPERENDYQKDERQALIEQYVRLEKEHQRFLTERGRGLSKLLEPQSRVEI